MKQIKSDNDSKNSINFFDKNDNNAIPPLSLICPNPLLLLEPYCFLFLPLDWKLSRHGMKTIASCLTT